MWVFYKNKCVKQKKQVLSVKQKESYAQADVITLIDYFLCIGVAAETTTASTLNLSVPIAGFSPFENDLLAPNLQCRI